MKLLDAATMRALDRFTIEDVGIPGIVLMEAAGRAVADEALRMLPPVAMISGPVIVLCGPGNNGGDGFVAARHMADAGLDVACLLVARRDDVRGDAATNLAALACFPVAVVEAPDDPVGTLARMPPPCLVIDAVFGTGLARDVSGPAAAVIDAANALPCPRLAVDLPSGVHSDSGRILGIAFRADATVTFAAAKIGHFVFPGRAFCGRVFVAPICIPTFAIDRASGAALLDRSCIDNAWPAREPDAYKNRYGHLLVAGGLPGRAGAILLAGTAAARCGAGLVSIATSTRAAERIEGRCPDLMVEAVLDDTMEPHTVLPVALASAIAGRTAIVAGPGLGTGDASAALLAGLLDSGLPAVLDADALTLVSARRDLATRLGPAHILTPHPGEAGRLLGCPAAQVQEDRLAAARKLGERTGAVIVLKGAGTIVASPDGRIAVNASGGPALATAGSGDVLAGMAGALLARGTRAFEAAAAAVHAHGLAGDRACARLGEDSVLASDLVDALSAVVSRGG